MPGIRQRMQAEAEHGPESHYEKIKSELALHMVLQILWAFVSSAQAQSLAAFACKDIEAVGGTPPRNLKALANIGCGGLYVFTPQLLTHGSDNCRSAAGAPEHGHWHRCAVPQPRSVPSPAASSKRRLLLVQQRMDLARAI